MTAGAVYETRAGDFTAAVEHKIAWGSSRWRELPDDEAPSGGGGGAHGEEAGEKGIIDDEADDDSDECAAGAAAGQRQRSRLWPATLVLGVWWGVILACAPAAFRAPPPR